MYDIVKHFVMTCNEEPPVIEVESVTHRKGIISTIILFLEVRGGNIRTCAQKVTKSWDSKYCTGYRSTPYGQTGTHVFCVYKEATLKGGGIIDDSLEFGVVDIKPIFFPSHLSSLTA